MESTKCCKHKLFENSSILFKHQLDHLSIVLVLDYDMVSVISLYL